MIYVEIASLVKRFGNRRELLRLPSNGERVKSPQGQPKGPKPGLNSQPVRCGKEAEEQPLEPLLDEEGQGG